MKTRRLMRRAALALSTRTRITPAERAKERRERAKRRRARAIEAKRDRRWVRRYPWSVRVIDASAAGETMAWGDRYQRESSARASFNEAIARYSRHRGKAVVLLVNPAGRVVDAHPHGR